MYGWRWKRSKGGDPVREQNKIKIRLCGISCWHRGEEEDVVKQKRLFCFWFVFLFSDWPHCVFVWIATRRLIIEDAYTSLHAHTHTHCDDYHTPYYWCTDNCLAPMGLPIHCNPSNTLNFHFKQKLNRQKTQGSILFPPLSFLFFFSQPHFCHFLGFPSSSSNHLFPPPFFLVFVKFNIKIINCAFTRHQIALT